MVNKEKYFSTTEIAKILSVSRQAIYKWRDQGAPHIKMGDKTYRYNLEDVIKWRTDYMKNPKNGPDGKSS